MELLYKKYRERRFETFNAGIPKEELMRNHKRGGIVQMIQQEQLCEIEAGTYSGRLKFYIDAWHLITLIF